MSLNGALSPALAYQIGYAIHAISPRFRPDNAGELIFQGVASAASHRDFDNTVQGDLTWTTPRQTIGAGIYAGLYHVAADDSSLVFPVDSMGAQSGSTPIAVASHARADNLVLGLHVDDLWTITDRLRIDIGLRWDALTGFTNGQNRQTGGATGQFNFDPDELAYIDHHAIVLDHQFLVGISSGLAYH